jgi:hypothetical protein
MEVIRATDTTYTTGNPGIGFWLEGRLGVGTNADYGFSALTATDGRQDRSESRPLSAHRVGPSCWVASRSRRLSIPGRQTAASERRERPYRSGAADGHYTKQDRLGPV